jgi:uncharacterized membrane protein YhaH (DUF805 family)
VLRTLFSLHGRVNRRLYLVTGISLMLLKYVLDASAIYLIAHVVWTPWDYLVPLLSYKVAKLAAVPAEFAFVFALWTLPFIWIGVTMMMKRAIDAGKSPAWCAFFVVPLVNYAVMLWLAALPSVPANAELATTGHKTAAARYRSALVGVLIATGLALFAILLSVFAFGSYGVSLFLAAPFIQGMVVGYAYNRDAPRSAAETTTVISLSLMLVAGVVLLFALEGVVCLLMALPLALGLGALGGLVGRVMARAQSGSGLGFAAALFAVPSGAMMEKMSVPPPTYEVVTVVNVAAPPQTVWNHVVQFKEITEAPAWYFRAGIAYPLRASIDGVGVGAIRRCEFSTGAFVEPITEWEPPARLAFDVVDQPPPLRELSIYTRVYAPHLDGYFKSSHGEFRMIPLANGQTRLEGHTWYSVAIYPQGYWRGASEILLHRIHRRVLEQVKRESELAAAERVAFGGDAGR